MLRDTGQLNEKISGAGRLATVTVLLLVAVAVAGLRGPTPWEAAAAEPPDSAKNGAALSGEDEANLLPEQRAGAAGSRRGTGPQVGVTSTASVGGESAADVDRAGEERTPLSLAWVPRDAVMVVAVRPAELLARPAIQPLADALQQEGEDELFGIPLHSIERLTLIFLPHTQQRQAPPPAAPAPYRAPQPQQQAIVEPHLAGWVLHMTEPVDLDQFAGVLGEDPEARRYGTATYYQSSEGATRVYLADDQRTAIVSQQQPYLRRILVAGSDGASRTSWAEAWHSAAAAADAGYYLDVVIVEAKRDIPWTKPEDIPYDADQPLPELGGFFDAGFNALFGDGSVQFISKEADESLLRAIITKAGGELVDRRQWEPEFPSR